MKKLLIKSLSLTTLMLSSLGLIACENDPKSVSFTLSSVKNAEIHQEHQAAYLADNDYSKIGTYSAFAELEEFSKPIPITLSWKVTKAKKYIVNVSEKEDMSDAVSFEVKQKKLDFYNAKVNTKYYYTVSAVYKSNTFTSEVASFTTKNTTLRNIFVDGVDNVRDLGGYKALDNKMVKQGMIYRSAQMNKDKVNDMQILATDSGLKTLREQLKIKTDIDLRKNVEIDGTIENSGLKKSPIGDDVNYQSLPMYYDGQNMLNHSDANKLAVNLQSVKDFFNILANKDNYPVVFHCVQGKDRTGMLSYILGALLGESELDLYRDYLFTNFSNSVGSPCKPGDISSRYGLTIAKVEGSSLSEKTYKYLNETLSIPADTLNSVINNLCE